MAASGLTREEDLRLDLPDEAAAASPPLLGPTDAAQAAATPAVVEVVGGGHESAGETATEAGSQGRREKSDTSSKGASGLYGG